MSSSKSAQDCISFIPTELLIQIIRSIDGDDYTLLTATQRVSKRFQTIVLDITKGGRMEGLTAPIWSRILGHLDPLSFARAEMSCSSLRKLVFHSGTFPDVKRLKFSEKLMKNWETDIGRDTQVVIHPALRRYLATTEDAAVNLNFEDVDIEKYRGINATSPPADRIRLIHENDGYPLRDVVISSRYGPRSEFNRALSIEDVLEGTRELMKLPLSDSQIFAFCGEDPEDWDPWENPDPFEGFSKMRRYEVNDIWVNSGVRDLAQGESKSLKQDRLHDQEGEFYGRFSVAGTAERGTVVILCLPSNW
ncbi:hypothetical protein ABW19_dt0203684 [Dactylella cylindrospora]|nr:hypothetical protein ABW19_dt0203684 [Dactylella cylindrospora]